MTERADHTMYTSEQHPCEKCGSGGRTWLVLGRGLAGWYHPNCMHAMIELRQQVLEQKHGDND